jgi:hypothetical protein
VSYALATCLVPLPIVLAVLYKIPLSERATFASMACSLASFILGLFFGWLNGFGLILPLGVGLTVLLIVEVGERVFFKTSRQSL